MSDSSEVLDFIFALRVCGEAGSEYQIHSTSTRPAANGPSAPCSPRIPESSGIAPAPRISSAEAGMPIPVPVTAAPILTGAAAQSRRLRPSRQDKADGGPGHTARWLPVVE